MLTDIPDGGVCYIDATIFYYHLVSTPALSDDCSDLLTRMAQGCVHGVTSSVAVAEATHKVMLAEVVHRHGVPLTGLPDMRAVIPLMPEPIVKHDGTDKNDCERNATTRFVAKLRQDHPHLKFIITEDSLSAHAPHIETLHTYGLHYILGVKAGDHAYLFQQVQAAEHGGRVTSYERPDRAAGVSHRFRFVKDIPLNASHPAMRVNFIEYGEIGATKVQHWSWVTDLRVSKRNVYPLMRGGTGAVED
jgi:hypothetical protein